MNRSNTYYLRKAHRYLGIFIGIQFLAWTAGGLYFSWNDITEIRGDHLRNTQEVGLQIDNLISPSELLQNLNDVESVTAMRLTTLFDSTFYRIEYINSGGVEDIAIADAVSGKIRDLISETEARRLAAKAYKGNGGIEEAFFVEKTGEHHEYRGHPLPAWQIQFDDQAGTHIYIFAKTGEVTRFRTNRWRWFDWLWMLHTMDYEGRDDFNNLLLKSFSILGLITIISGFTLFGFTSPALRKKRSK